MSTDAGSTTVLLVGALLVRLVLTGDYLRYVRSGTGPWLLVAGALLVALGLVGLLTALRRGGVGHEVEHSADHGEGAGGGEGEGDDHGHPPGDDHGHLHLGGDRIGWLLLAPVLALLLVAPPALGSFGVDRSTPGGVTVRPGGAVFTALPAGRPPVAMTILEFDQRSADRSGASLGAAPVRLTGFVARPQDGTGLRLARYQIACCAADAVAAVVRVIGLAGAPPARDGWLQVIGTYQWTGVDGVPELEVTSSQPIPAPVDPYES